MNWINSLKGLLVRIPLEKRLEDLLYEAEYQHLLHREHAADLQATANMYEQRAIRLRSQMASRSARS